MINKSGNDEDNYSDEESQGPAPPQQLQNLRQRQQPTRALTQEELAMKATIEQRREMAQNNKQAMQKFGALMAEMANIQDDVNTQLKDDQKKIDKANENMEEGVRDTEGAKGQMNTKRDAIFKNFNRFACLFVTLLILSIYMVYSTFVAE